MAAVLLVFQYGQPRIFFAMARDGLLPPFAAKIHPKYRTPHITTILTGVLVAVGAAVADDAATYDLTNIGTLWAFALVCLGVLVLRLKEPERPRPFRVPFFWVVTLGGVGACLFVMRGLPDSAWVAFGVWMLDRPRDLLPLRLPPLAPARRRPDPDGRLPDGRRPHPQAPIEGKQ
jgi:APA family basic amino acid/polyamine antiporter